MKTQQFGATLRLKCAHDFTRVFRDPETKIVHYKQIRIHARQNEFMHPRLGITVSRRNVRHAVHRNRIKRQIRESFRLCCSILPAMDFIVVCRPQVQSSSPDQLRQILTQAWQRFSAEQSVTQE